MICAGYAVEPLECIGELEGAWLGRRTVLLRDSPGSFRSLLKLADSARIWPRVILYADEPKLATVCLALKLGAISYIKTPQDMREISQAISNEIEYFSNISELRIRAYKAMSALDLLTNREKEIINLMSRGFRNSELADALGLSTRTVVVHRANLLKKLRVRSSIEASRLFIESSYILDRIPLR